MDVRDFNLGKIPSYDVIFMFKLVHLIDSKKKKISEELIKKLLGKTRFIVVSFATRTFTQKPMNFPRRKGFELMLERNNLQFKKIKISNEIFYVVKI